MNDSALMTLFCTNLCELFQGAVSNMDCIAKIICDDAAKTIPHLINTNPNLVETLHMRYTKNCRKHFLALTEESN